MPFLCCVSGVSKPRLLAARGEVRRFRPGLDYTVAHYGVLTQDPQLDAVLCFVDDAGGAAREAWEGGEVGGEGAAGSTG